MNTHKLEKLDERRYFEKKRTMRGLYIMNHHEEKARKGRKQTAQS